MTLTAEFGPAAYPYFNRNDVEYKPPVKRRIIRDFRITDIAVIDKSGKRIVIMERKAA